MSVREHVDSVESFVIQERRLGLEAADVDDRKSQALRAERTAVSERSDGPGIGACRAVDPAGQTGRQQASCGRARDRQRADVYPEHGMPVASATQGPATALDGA